LVLLSAFPDLLIFKLISYEDIDIMYSNSCRSQMALGFLQSFNSEIEVYSAGTFPATKVNPRAIQAMSESGIDISKARQSQWRHMLMINGTL